MSQGIYPFNPWFEPRNVEEVKVSDPYRTPAQMLQDATTEDPLAFIQKSYKAKLTGVATGGIGEQLTLRLKDKPINFSLTLYISNHTKAQRLAAMSEADVAEFEITIRRIK